MYEEESPQVDNVIVLRHRKPGGVPMADRLSEPDAAHEPEVPAGAVLNAERGIINTGTVHGGQYVTTVGFSGDRDHGADGGV
ncbi:S-type pyocin domain-containing protein [Streptomyces sp. NPDC046876]|uniref:S-type pyocin domain-containing protein n=1 Tax=Streptomyces sp. NPDC046876 TaxID=3155616 RepID=UPI0033D29E40